MVLRPACPIKEAASAVGEGRPGAVAALPATSTRGGRASCEDLPLGIMDDDGGIYVDSVWQHNYTNAHLATTLAPGSSGGRSARFSGTPTMVATLHGWRGVALQTPSAQATDGAALAPRMDARLGGGGRCGCLPRPRCTTQRSYAMLRAVSCVEGSDTTFTEKKEPHYDAHR